VLGIQSFKKRVAESVVNAKNASMVSMASESGDIVDLFQKTTTPGKDAGGGDALIEQGLWPEAQYAGLVPE
jgi:hypothetical protein